MAEKWNPGSTSASCLATNLAETERRPDTQGLLAVISDYNITSYCSKVWVYNLGQSLFDFGEARLFAR